MPMIIVGDFNSCTLDGVLPSFQQHVTCPTRHNKTVNKTVDLCYSSVDDSYTLQCLPPLVRADLNIVHLLPMYRQKLKRVPPVKRQVKIWTTDAVEQLKGCYACTDWDVLFEGTHDINEHADILTDYVKFCQDSIIPEKTVTVIPNTKPWITQRVKKALINKQKAFESRDAAAIREAKAVIRAEIGLAKSTFQDKVEKQYQTMNTCDAFRNLKVMAGDVSASQSTRSNTLPGAIYLNKFYTRFNSKDFTSEHTELLTAIPSPSPYLSPSPANTPNFIHCMHNFLCNRPQLVKAGSNISPNIITNTRAPQGCVGNSIIYSLYSNNIRSECDSNVLIKYPDDAAEVACLNGSDSFLAYENTISMISMWCKEHFLELNVCKTKELCIDFCTSGLFDGPLCNGGEAVEVTDTFKYLGITLDNNLTFGSHVQGVYRKCQQRLYLLRKLRSFHVDPKLLLLLYKNIIESVLTYCNICFFPAMSVSKKICFSTSAKLLTRT